MKVKEILLALTMDIMELMLANERENRQWKEKVKYEWWTGLYKEGLGQ